MLLLRHGISWAFDGSSLWWLLPFIYLPNGKEEQKKLVPVSILQSSEILYRRQSLSISMCCYVMITLLGSSCSYPTTIYLSWCHLV
ncbi:hypothetical protein GDO81_007202 [Engystomops pustulosus]|uniref:Uncharacterized protein n=1 Tax=Engystomops pustulosus TaxID=76066 RepID=A0AAV7C5R6_ENGPU|nr:hypothetical protein GDO81_007202 [Engystomops pustulosus]